MILEIKPGADPADPRQIKLMSAGEAVENAEILEAHNNAGLKTVTARITWKELEIGHQEPWDGNVHSEIQRKQRTAGK
jgi:hypothetical protein